MTRQLPDHFLSSEDGNLYDTRVPGWSGLPPLRANFRRHHRNIATTHDLKATLRAGPYAWPGGYELSLITDDGDTLTFADAEGNLISVLDAIAKRHNDGWRVVGCDLKSEVEEDPSGDENVSDEIATEFEERSQ